MAAFQSFSLLYAGREGYRQRLLPRVTEHRFTYCSTNYTLVYMTVAPCASFCCSDPPLHPCTIKPFLPSFLDIAHVRKNTRLSPVFCTASDGKLGMSDFYNMVCVNSVSDLSFSLQEELELCRRLEDLQRREKFLIARENPHDTSM